MIGQAVRLQKAGVTMVLVEYSSLFQGGMGGGNIKTILSAILVVALVLALLFKLVEQVNGLAQDHTPSHDTVRLKVEEKHLLPSFTLDTSLEYLIPTTVGAGACTTALTDFLVLTHNNFIKTCPKCFAVI